MVVEEYMDKGTDSSLTQKKALIFLMKAFNLTGMLLSNYITLIATGMGYSAQTASVLVSIPGIAYPFVSFCTGMLCDRFLRTRVLMIAKCFSMITMIVALFSGANSLIMTLLIVVACIECGVECIFFAIVTDMTVDGNRLLLFSVLQLGGNVGLAVSSLISMFVLQMNIHFFILILLSVSVACVGTLWLLENKLKDWIPENAKRENRERTYSNNKEDTIGIYAVFQYLWSCKSLLLFSVIQIFYSIVSVQINYGLALKIHSDFGMNAEMIFGLLLGIYYVVMIVINILVSHMKKKHSILGSMACSGCLFVIAMFFMSNFKTLGFLCIAMVLWAAAQLIFKLYNSVYVAEKCDPKYIGVVTSFLPNIASAGVVIGPILCGFINERLGMHAMWLSLVVFALIGTILMTGLYVKENREKK